MELGDGSGGQAGTRNPREKKRGMNGNGNGDLTQWRNDAKARRGGFDRDLGFCKGDSTPHEPRRRVVWLDRMAGHRRGPGFGPRQGAKQHGQAHAKTSAILFVGSIPLE